MRFSFPIRHFHSPKRDTTYLLRRPPIIHTPHPTLQKHILLPRHKPLRLTPIPQDLPPQKPLILLILLLTLHLRLHLHIRHELSRLLLTLLGTNEPRLPDDVPENVVGVVALLPVSGAVLLAAADPARQGLRDVDVCDAVVVFVLFYA